MLSMPFVFKRTCNLIRRKNIFMYVITTAPCMDGVESCNEQGCTCRVGYMNSDCCECSVDHYRDRCFNDCRPIDGKEYNTNRMQALIITVCSSFFNQSSKKKQKQINCKHLVAVSLPSFFVLKNKLERGEVDECISDVMYFTVLFDADGNDLIDCYTDIACASIRRRMSKYQCCVTSTGISFTIEGEEACRMCVGEL